MTAHDDRIDEVTSMVAHLTLAQCRPDRCDNFVQAYHDLVLPALRSELGYRGVYLLVDRSSGRVVTLSLWDTAQDARAYEQGTLYQDHLSIVHEQFGSPISCDVFDVDAQA